MCRFRVCARYIVLNISRYLITSCFSLCCKVRTIFIVISENRPVAFGRNVPTFSIVWPWALLMPIAKASFMRNYRHIFNIKGSSMSLSLRSPQGTKTVSLQTDIKYSSPSIIFLILFLTCSTKINKIYFILFYYILNL